LPDLSRLIGFGDALVRRFDEPISPPKGKPLVTLKDAAAYIMALPKSKQHAPEWQTATEMLLMAADDRGPADARSYWNAEGIEPRQARSGDRATAQGRQGLSDRAMSAGGRCLGPPILDRNPWALTRKL
jgi:hypothetical protein